jgi:iron only hydrogenase large subunit-like protein
MAEVSGGLAEAVIRAAYYKVSGKEAEKGMFKKIRASGNFRDLSVFVGENEIKVAVIDGLTGLERLWSSIASGIQYDLVEVMVCPGGCVRGGGLTRTGSKEVIRNRAKTVFQNEENEALILPCKSPALLNLYEKYTPANKELAEKTIYLTRYSARDVLL